MNKTGYFTHADCARHEMGPGHPKCPERLAAIDKQLGHSGVRDMLDQRNAPLAAIGDIELAHDRMHVAALRGLSDQLADDILAGGPGHAQIDPDTALNVHTWTAALRAAGAAIAATDAVLAGEMTNAFCAVRPPGHHAEHAKAMGFCFFNNIAIAAKYALARHGLKRVAIVDFDVHHGNGTEDIVRGDNRILMVSFFQHPLFPFSGADTAAPNMVNLPVPANTRGMDIRELIDMLWMPRLDAFKPEMIFISAGFDAHRDDELGQLSLNEQDFSWITDRIKQVADRHAKGRIVSALEGGYSSGALGRSVEAHVRVLAGLQSLEIP